MGTNFYEDSFPVTLISNVKNPGSAPNKPNDFTTHLLKPIHLAGDWEVALTDIQYPGFWPDVFKETQFGLLVCFESAKVHSTQGLQTPTTKDVFLPTGLFEQSDTHFKAMEELLKDLATVDYAQYLEHPKYYYNIFQVFIIKRGHYGSIEALGKMIAESFNREQGRYWKQLMNEEIKLEYKYDATSGRSVFSVTGPGRMEFLYQDPYLMETLFAFPKGRPLRTKNNQQSPLLSARTPLISMHYSSLDHLSSMQVACNLIREHPVGNTAAPILAFLPVDSSKFGSQHHYMVPIKKFRAVNQASFETIKIEIYTDSGELFPFTDDPNNRVICELEFVKRPAPKPALI